MVQANLLFLLARGLLYDQAANDDMLQVPVIVPKPYDSGFRFFTRSSVDIEGVLTGWGRTNMAKLNSPATHLATTG